MLKIILLLILSIACGILGRMGGSDKYNTRWRDIGCSLCVLIGLFILFGFNLSLWWAYLLIFGLSWAFLSTYWDGLFKFDNLWFSGFMMGMSAFPYYENDLGYVIRAILLALIWGSLNKYLPKKVFIWRRDVAEEFLRYSVVILTMPILLMR